MLAMAVVSSAECCPCAKGGVHALPMGPPTWQAGRLDDVLPQVQQHDLQVAGRQPQLLLVGTKGRAGQHHHAALRVMGQGAGLLQVFAWQVNLRHVRRKVSLTGSTNTPPCE